MEVSRRWVSFFLVWWSDGQSSIIKGWKGWLKSRVFVLSKIWLDPLPRWALWKLTFFCGYLRSHWVENSLNPQLLPSHISAPNLTPHRLMPTSQTSSLYFNRLTVMSRASHFISIPQPPPSYALRFKYYLLTSLPGKFCLRSAFQSSFQMLQVQLLSETLLYQLLNCCQNQDISSYFLESQMGWLFRLSVPFWAVAGRGLLQIYCRRPVGHYNQFSCIKRWANMLSKNLRSTECISSQPLLCGRPMWKRALFHAASEISTFCTLRGIPSPPRSIPSLYNFVCLSS